MTLLEWIKLKWNGPENTYVPPVKIDGWRLTFTLNNGQHTKDFDHPDLKNLWKIYSWYLTKDTEKYNVKSNQGYDIIHRHDVVGAQLRKIKLLERDWVTKENNDET
jgi:hypothetical protein